MDARDGRAGSLFVRRAARVLQRWWSADRLPVSCLTIGRSRSLATGGCHARPSRWKDRRTAVPGPIIVQKYGGTHGCGVTQVVADRRVRAKEEGFDVCVVVLASVAGYSTDELLDMRTRSPPSPRDSRAASSTCRRMARRAYPRSRPVSPPSNARGCCAASWRLSGVEHIDTDHA